MADMPDFDSMSPEEIMSWMETLAKRQGASEGFTTAADMDIAEVDPDTVVIDEPGYVPYGQEAPTQTSLPRAPITPPQAVRPQEEVRAWEPEPVAASEPEPESETVPIEVVQPPVQQSRFEAALSETAEEGSLAWLESLAAGQDDNLFNLDLSSLGESPAEAAPAATDPVSWLEDLTRSQGELSTPTPSPYTQPNEADSLTWLETLAKRQGANPDELLTSADLDIPAPEADVEAPAYTPFSFDTPTTHRTPPAASEPLHLEDPTAFLDSLAMEQGYSEEGVRATQPAPKPAEVDMSLEGIQDAINEGRVTPEQMQVFLDHETDVAANQPAMPMFELEDDEVFDPDAPAIPAELPDWLLEQVGPPPTAETKAPEPEAAVAQPKIEDLFAQPAASDDMPDWLRGDISTSDDVDLESIFAQTKEEDEFAPQTVTVEEKAAAEIEIDPNDPWVEAFDLEHEQGMADISTVPDWYEQNLNDPERIAAIEHTVDDQLVAAAASLNGLSDDGLPEENVLVAGVSQELPDWFPEPITAESVDLEETLVFDEEPAAVSDIPDWLREIGAAGLTEDVPDWLNETLDAEQQDVSTLFDEPEVVAQTAPEPAPVIVQPPVAAAKPVQTRPVNASLSAARSHGESGDLDASLLEYETLIRSSSDLDAVVEDLSRMVKAYRSNPAVHRVLGDGLMRQGKLQAALDTYREALNQL